ncbi:hypothetical protein [Mesorhizobium sp. Root695]|uniref:hypothetical protein n=1 Tax=Mesorhizobium sp. Root695 TaxID=1736589 RepID=UPI000AEAFA9E|nr:hypothetical protein [Mesorhizobium sp. Root695]
MKTGEILLVAATEANLALVAALELAPEQMDFVASNAESLKKPKPTRTRGHASSWPGPVSSGS